MALNLELLSDAARTTFLARIAYTLTICARDTYDAGTENVLNPQALRAYNELLHRVTGSLIGQLSGTKGASLEAIVEMMRSFGVHHDRAGEMDWALKHVLQKTEKSRG